MSHTTELIGHDSHNVQVNEAETVAVFLNILCPTCLSLPSNVPIFIWIFIL